MPGTQPVVVTWADPSALQKLRTEIRALAEQVDIVVFSIHWGLSDSTQVIDYQREVGADLVLGHHPVARRGSRSSTGDRSLTAPVTLPSTRQI
jgi:poly-gamma-glutamate synthesis protein (capsule biosynthesis protein)